MCVWRASANHNIDAITTLKKLNTELHLVKKEKQRINENETKNFCVARAKDRDREICGDNRDLEQVRT